MQMCVSVPDIVIGIHIVEARNETKRIAATDYNSVIRHTAYHY